VLADLMEFENPGDAAPQASHLMVLDSSSRNRNLTTGFDGLGAAGIKETPCLRDILAFMIRIK
jgi:hypothetical protein